MIYVNNSTPSITMSIENKDGVNYVYAIDKTDSKGYTMRHLMVDSYSEGFDTVTLIDWYAYPLPDNEIVRCVIRRRLYEGDLGYKYVKSFSVMYVTPQSSITL
jgi:hypothetical protein